MRYTSFTRFIFRIIWGQVLPSWYINSQILHTWSHKNPHAFIKTSLHLKKIGVWCVISHKKIIASIFFKSIINTKRYAEIIYDFIAPLPVDKWHTYFQQDGGRPHTSQSIAWFIGTIFCKKVDFLRVSFEDYSAIKKPGFQSAWLVSLVLTE